MVESLHTVHRPITTAFPYPSGSGASLHLSEDQRAAFDRDGFVAPIPILDKSQVEELRQRLTSIGERIVELTPSLYEVEASWIERPSETVLHFLGAWMIDEWFHDLAFHPAITTKIADALSVDRLRFWHDQVFWKPPQHAGVVPWHQDYAYWNRTAPACHATLFLALDDMDEENGALQIVPGSHHGPLLPATSFGGPMNQLIEHLTEEERAAFAPEMVRLKAGEASIHHSHAMHGSGPNRADRPRRGVVLNFMGPDVRVAKEGPLLRGVDPIAVGELVDGPHFPIVLPQPG